MQYSHLKLCYRSLIVTIGLLETNNCLQPSIVYVVLSCFNYHQRMETALQFKITLNYLTPKIWRRIQVPNSYTFWDLHCAIQDAMGWTNSHLHGFYMTNKKYDKDRPTIIQMPNPEWDGPSALHEAHEYLTEWFPKRVKQCTYTYDFGDTWDHTVAFERAVPADHKPYPRCVAGQRTCPPEDCGGPGGYMDLLKVINEPKTAEGMRLRDWMGLVEGEIYDPTQFSAEQIKFADPHIWLKEYLSYIEQSANIRRK